jgi:hypothetical protein
MAVWAAPNAVHGKQPSGRAEGLTRAWTRVPEVPFVPRQAPQRCRPGVVAVM